MDASESAVGTRMCHQRWYVENIGRHGGNTFNVAAPGESREPPLNIVRLTLFECRRHPDAKPKNRLQTITLKSTIPHMKKLL